MKRRRLVFTLSLLALVSCQKEKISIKDTSNKIQKKFNQEDQSNLIKDIEKWSKDGRIDCSKWVSYPVACYDYLFSSHLEA